MHSPESDDEPFFWGGLLRACKHAKLNGKSRGEACAFEGSTQCAVDVIRKEQHIATVE